MAILVIGADLEIGTELVRRLVAEGDEVRVVESDPGRAETWSGLGAYVASGRGDDPDLLERAATNVRTAVVIERKDLDLAETAGSLVEAAKLAVGVPEEGVRIVLCSADPSASAIETIASSGLQYVVLRTRARRAGALAGRRTVPAGSVVEAIDAADDLAGEIHLDLDLADPGAWAELRAEPPAGG
jgi:uncharacterized protein YbjT (DUF2867 family)